MTQQQALTPFEGLESFKGYTEEQRKAFFDDLFCIDQNALTGVEFIDEKDITETLEILAYLRWCKDFIEICYKYGSQFVIDYVESQKGVKVLDGKFTVANKSLYDYSENTHWVSVKNDEKELGEYRKELEKVCRVGGNFDGKVIGKIECTPEKELRFKIEK